VDEFQSVKKRQKDNHADTRIRIAKRKAQREAWSVRLQQIIAKGDDALATMIEDFKMDNQLKPYHYALICLSPKKYVKSWIDFVLEEVVPKLNEREKIFFIIKTVIALEQHMTKVQVTKMLDIVYSSLNPTAAILLDYYFPAYVKNGKEKEINNIVFEVLDKGRSIESVVADFEKKTGEFFRELYKLIS
jgi:hypothetical protein